MDRVDVLGDDRERFGEFTKELLSETSDIELQKIVEQAAKALNSPIALVSLLLDHIQFFKAHIGLPKVLSTAQGTHRDVSFCQFVVKEGKTFEVNDASNDPRIPQHVVKEYNINSYLGVPIMINNNVVGSLCVLDTKKRGFTEDDHKSLNQLADLVNLRLKAITQQRRQTRLDLTDITLNPAITELSNTINGLQSLVTSGNLATTTMRSFLGHIKHVLEKEQINSEALELSIEAADNANKLNESLLNDMDMTLQDSLDCINAMKRIVVNIESSRLSELVIASQDLSRNATNLIGGFPLPEFETDPLVYTKGNLAIAIITNCLLTMTAELGVFEAKNGIKLDIKEKSPFIELLFSAKELDKASAERIVDVLKKHLQNEHPTVVINTVDNKIVLKFRTISSNSLTD